MLKKRIIPCLDVKDGRVVKGINFLDLVDAGDPVQQAKFYSEYGADEICFLDISASLENRDTILKMVEKTAEEVFIPLTVGGGVRSIDNIQSLLKAGADKVSVNSSAIKNPNFLRECSKEFGSQCVVSAIDVKKIDSNAPHETFLILDATTGQNAINQVEEFKKITTITWIIMTNLDGTAKGGILVAVGRKFKLPIVALGMGEKEDDLQIFNAQHYSKALMDS